MSKRRKIFNLSQLPDGIGGGATQFIQLTDTPNTYTGQTGKSVRVNSTETGIEYYTPSEVGSTISFLDLIDTPSSYTGNNLKILRVNSGSTAIEYDPNTYVITTRNINTNNGLTGGGNLSIDRTIELTGQALALHNLTTNGYIIRTGAGVVVGRTITSGVGISITNGDGIAGNTTITLNAVLNNITDVIITTPINNQTLVYNGSNWVNLAYTTGTVTSIIAGTGLTGGTITSSGTIGFDTAWGDLRYSRLIDVLNNQTSWSHISSQNGIDFTPYTTGSAGYPSTLGFAVAFYANTSDSTSGYGRAFALNRAYNTENYHIGSPNTSGVHNGWRLLYHSGNLTISTLGGVPTTTTLTINGTSQDLSTNRTFSVGTVTSIIAGTGLTGGTITGSGTISLTGQALAFHNLSTNGIIYRNGATIGTRTITGSTFITITNGDGASGNPTISLGTLNLGNLSDVTLTTPASGQVLSFNGTNWINSSISGGGGGTVTSIATGVGLTGGIITTTGTISVVFGTTISTVAEGNDTRILNGQTAFGWGNHALAGYLLSSTASSTYIPLTRTLTINGTTLNLSADRIFSVGTVTSVATGTGLTGGTITGSGTISLTGQALALHNLATNGIITRTGTNIVATRNITAGTGISIVNGDGVAGNPTISSTITQYTDALARTSISLTTTGFSGSSTYSSSTGVLNVPNYTLNGLGGQPLNTNLTSLGGLTYVSASFVKMTAAGTFTLDTNTYYLSSNPNGYTSNTGNVTSVSGTGTVNGISLSGTVTTSGNITLGGTLGSIANSQLNNSTITVGTTSIALGSSATTITGLSSVTSTTFVGALTGNASTSTTLQTARTLTIGSTGKTFNGGANVSWTLAEIGAAVTNQTMHIGTTAVTINRASGSLSLNGVNIDGTSSGVIRTVSGTNTAELVRGNMADNDQFRILVGGISTNAGYVEIATADDGTEPIYIRQYTGVFTTLIRTATILDGSGNTSFPGTVTASSIIRSGGSSSQFLKADGSIDTNTYYLSSNPNGYTSNTGTVTSVSGTGSYNGLTLSGTVTTSGNITLGGTPTGTWPISVSGNASTSTTLQTARTINGTSFNGGADITTANWGTARTITIGSTGKSVNGSINVAWSLAEIGAYAATNPNGYTSNTGTVTSVSGTGSYNGLTLSGTVTTSGNITLGGTPTGTWPISVSGSSNSAIRIVYNDGPRNLSDRLPNSFARTVNWDFVTNVTTGSSGNYAGVMTFSPWEGTTASTGDSSYQLAFTNATGISGSGLPGLRLRKGIDTTWGAWYDIITSAEVGLTGANIIPRLNFQSYLLIDNWIRVGNGTGLYSVGGAYFLNQTIGTYNGWTLRSSATNHVAMHMQQINGTTYGAIYADSNDIGFTNAALSGWRLRVDTGGNGYFGGDVVAFTTSDMRLKNDITPIDHAVDKIEKIGGYSFNWSSNQSTYKGKDYGVIAQEIKEIMPELVTERDNGYLAVKYEKLIPLLIESIKELNNKIKILENK